MPYAGKRAWVKGFAMEDAAIRVGLDLRPLTLVESQFIGVVKELTAEVHDLFSAMGASNERDQAIIRLEEAVMWATKHIALHGHSNDQM